jgi:hypothetical protein
MNGALNERPLLKFTLWVLVLLPTCFVAWWLLGTWLVAPAHLAATMILKAWLPEVVTDVLLQGTNMVLLTEYVEIGGRYVLPAEGVPGGLGALSSDDTVGLRIDTRVLSYAIPFYAALHFSTPMTATWERLARGLLVLWLVIALGLVATAAKDLMRVAGAGFLNLPGVPPADAIAIAYQFLTLIAPPLLPVLLWAYEARDVPAFRALLPSALVSPDAQRAEKSGRQGRPSQES